MGNVKIFSKGTLNWFDWFLIIGIVGCNLAHMLITNSFDLLGFVASVSGLICVVLISKKSISNYIFGVVNAVTYALVAYESNILGDAALNALYYFPMQFVGWYNWRKNNGGENTLGQEDESMVKARHMTLKQRILWGFITLVSTLVVGYILDKYTLDPQPYKDAFTTCASVIAMYLMVNAYFEQWIIWFLVNLISTIMWLGVLLDGNLDAGLMVIMWLFYLVVNVNGWIVWSREERV